MGSLLSLTRHFPAAYEIYSLAQLATRRGRRARMLDRAGWMAAGIALGAGAAVLFTPRSGPEMRKQISDQALRARDSIESSIESSIPSMHDAKNGPARKASEREGEPRHADA